MRNPIVLTAMASILAVSTPAVAQTTQPRDILGSILGTLFGGKTEATSTLDSQWAAGQTPLRNQQYQFESRVDTEARAGNLDADTAARLKGDYSALVELENRYAADGRFTTQERADLTDRYGALTQVLADRRYQDGASNNSGASLANGQAAFNQRVDAAVASRRITRTQGTRLRSDYAATVRLESSYLRDGTFSASERNDLDARMDALDAQLGDTNYTSALTPRTRLDAVARALPTSGLPRTAKTQLMIELGDLMRLADAYAGGNVSAEDRAYLDRRILDVETRARIRR